MEWEVVMDIMQRATKLGVDENIQKILLRFDGENWCLVSSNEQHGWHVSCQGFQPRQVQWSAHVFFSGYREGPLNRIWLNLCFSFSNQMWQWELIYVHDNQTGISGMVVQKLSQS